MSKLLGDVVGSVEAVASEEEEDEEEEEEEDV